MFTSLFFSNRFFPVFATQVGAVLVDNLYRTAFVLLLLYSGASQHLDLTTKYHYSILSAALLTLPFLLFSALAGTLCDKMSKSTLTVYFKAAELAIVTLGAYAILINHTHLMLLSIFLLGCHSAFLSPIKLAILPEYLPDSSLLSANAFFEIGIFCAILLGEILANLLFAHAQYGVYILTLLIFTLSLATFCAALYLPKTEALSPQTQVNWNLLSSTLEIIQKTRQHHTLYACILGISWFWLVSSIVVNEIPNLVVGRINAGPQVLTLILVTFGLGISAGALACNRMLKNKIEITYVPLAALGLSFMLYDLSTVIHALHSANTMITLHAFLGHFTYLHILFDFFTIGFLGGLYHVPLYTMMLHECPTEQRARTMACHNIISTLFMMIGAGLNFFLAHIFQGSPAHILSSVALIFASLTFYIARLMPYTILRSVLKFIFQHVYNTTIHGREHFCQTHSKRSIIIANHTSWLDALLLATFLPERLTFAFNASVQRHFFARYFTRLNRVYLIDHNRPMSIRGLINAVNNGERVVIFPEPLSTLSGAMTKIYESPALVALHAQACIIPVHIDGLQNTLFKRLKVNSLRSLLPTITIRVFPAEQLLRPTKISNRKAREHAGDHLFRIMTTVYYESNKHSGTLFDALLHAMHTHSNGARFTDISRQSVSYRQLVMKTFILSYPLQPTLQNTDRAGLLLPTALPTVVCFFSLQALDKIPVMLNYTHGPAQVQSCCETAGIEHIITSRRFIKLAKLDKTIAHLDNSGLQIHYLEDIASSITLLSKIKGLLSAYLPRITQHFAPRNAKAQDTAVILFTSGSEGLPKGVALSHDNLHANIAQLTSVVDLNHTDLIFNTLPLFHSFGLMGAFLLPILTGVKIFLYPNPLQYRVISELIYDTNATILFGTDYTLNLYAKHANPYDFYSLRYVFAGAEKLKTDTFSLWSEKFGIRILEAYGLTEASPALCANTAMHYKRDTVGRFLPKVQHRLTAVQGLENGGRLWIKGPNIMQGYLLNHQPKQIQPLQDGWHDTGDIVDIDAQGFVKIVDRVKRFAKIAGEMVSLSAVEASISTLSSAAAHAILTQPCPKKGEQLILFTEDEQLKKTTIIQFFKANNIADLWLPKKIVTGPIPRLPTGKVDYQRLRTTLTDLN